MSDVRINNLVKEFPLRGGHGDEKFLAVDKVSLDIKDGEFLVLLGPSGCGKTTTLRCVAGLEHQTAGDIQIGQRLVNGLPAGDRDIAFVFQFYALYPHMNAYNNIAFPLRAMNVKKAEVDERVNRIAKLLKIEHTLNRRPGSLPSGEQQRIALGRAIIRQPQVFLMDEPLTNLDASLRTDMRTELKRLQAEMGVTTLYVTHDQTEAMSMAHRIAVMNKGVLQQVGAPLEIYDKPATLFVAGFIGTPPMNLIECTVSDQTAVSADGNLKLSSKRFDGISSNSPQHVFGVRAEDVVIRAARDDSSGVIGEILTRELLGDEIVYLINLGENQMRVKTEPTTEFKPTDRVVLTFDNERIHLFDKSTEQAVI